MYAKYSPKKGIVIQFDLENGKEIGVAFTFFYHAVKNTPFEGEIKEKLEAMVECMKAELVEKVERDQECANFQVCAKCCTEIDLRKKEHVFIDGNFLHIKCPLLKASDKRDI